MVSESEVQGKKTLGKITKDMINDAPQVYKRK